MIGTVVSSGIGYGKIYKLHRPKLYIQKNTSEPQKEMERLRQAIAETVTYFEGLKNSAVGKVSEEDLMIFDAHIMMADDPEFCTMIENMIKNDHVNAEYAVQNCGEEMARCMEGIDDVLFQERAVDLREIVYHINCNLMNIQVPDLKKIQEPVIVVASDLLPEDITSISHECAMGFVCEKGGMTGHGAILARNLGIPAITGIKELLQTVENGVDAILDGIEGKLIVSPDQIVLEEYQEKIKRAHDANDKLKCFSNKTSVTNDGYTVKISGNIGSLSDSETLIENGADGVGLFRTEFLFMESNNDFPSEEKQFQCYRNILESMQGKEVIIRTCDIGSDKQLRYYKFDQESNPALGLRAIRFSLRNRDLFRTQLRALYRASVHGKLGIMFPMISTVEEFIEAKSIAVDVKKELLGEGIPVASDVAVGCMIETPAAVILSDRLAKYADFFSIGTNDLIQYTLAADRNDANVSYLYQPLHPAVLNMIFKTVQSAHAHNIPCNMCGEMAGDVQLTGLLVGLGIDELSVNGPLVLRVREALRNVSYEEMKKIAECCLEMETAEEIHQILR